MATSSGGVRYLTAVDGANFSASFFPGEIAADLTVPLVDARLERAARELAELLFTQDYGKTASTVMSPLPPPPTVTLKKVTLGDFVRQWNIRCERYVKLLQDHRADITSSGALVRMMGIYSPRGEEAWMSAQMLSLESLSSALHPAGLVNQSQDSGSKHVQELYLQERDSPAVFNVEGLRLGSELCLWSSRTGQTLGCVLYLLCYEIKAMGDHLEGRHGGLRFKLVLSDSGPRDVFLRLIKEELSQVEAEEQRALYMPLAKVLGGNFVHFDCRDRWMSVDLKAMRLVPRELPHNPVVAAQKTAAREVPKRRFESAEVTLYGPAGLPRQLPYKRVMLA